jgi:hypothetical protein
MSYQHPLEAIKGRYPLQQSELSLYIRPNVKPPLNLNKLMTAFFCGELEQQKIKTPTTGNTSLLLSYKGYEGAVISWLAENEDLVVKQVQGAKSQKSYRTATAMDWTTFFAKESLAIAKSPQTPIKRLAIPHPLQIAGVVENRSESPLMRYEAFIAIAMLSWSEEEKLFVRDIK